MELSWTSNLTTPVPTEFFVSSISTPADLKAELTNEEYVTFCEAARTKGGFAGKWFELHASRCTPRLPNRLAILTHLVLTLTHQRPWPTALTSIRSQSAPGLCEEHHEGLGAG